MRSVRVACAAVALFAIACGSKNEDVAFERGEISDAISASESLTVHFTDSVSGRLVKDTTSKQPQVGEQLADACSLTDSIATGSWQRRELGSLPVSLLLPADYQRAPRGRNEPPDSMSQTFRTPDGDEIVAMRSANAYDLVDFPELGKESMCLVDVGKLRVHVETGRQLPTGEIKTLSASYHLPTGGWFVLHGRAHDVAAQHRQLRILREVRFAGFWQRPLS